MVYSSQYFWRTYLGDTMWFATNGHPLDRPLGVEDPDVPAQDWGGHGWTYWQWTATGSVVGMPPRSTATASSARAYGTGGSRP